MEADRAKRMAALQKAQQTDVEDSQLPGASRPLISPQPLEISDLPSTFSAGACFLGPI